MPRPPLYYTFGNHMHWVDMQWLWGYDVLPGSVRDMIALCREAGVHGNVNFDAVGYEKMAAECPEALAELRAAVQSGMIEPVGCSYGQPYGLFHGGESNIRQLTYGVRATMRHLGTRPRTFWEEEFYFFPQLPQLLVSAGYTGSCLFFQWTWHTPEVPKEPHSLILWQGADGTRIPTLPRNDLNIHQWPEEFDGLLTVDRLGGLRGAQAVVQWLELMPTKDWMCRSELLLPRLRQLAGDSRFEFCPRTAGGLIRELAKQVDGPAREYAMDDVWHGMTLGKNWDRHPLESREAESDILRAEHISAFASLLGRPYPRWDVYPTWELEEAWRELLAAQHHDNHECEGLCGSIGYTSLARASSLAKTVRERAVESMLDHLLDHKDGSLVFNDLGWSRDIVVNRCRRGADGDIETKRILVKDVPPFGFARADVDKLWVSDVEPTQLREDADSFWLIRGDFHVQVSKKTGGIASVRAPGWTEALRFAEGSFVPSLGLVDPESVGTEVAVSGRVHDGDAHVFAAVSSRSGYEGYLTVRLAPDEDAIELGFGDTWQWPKPEPGLLRALTLPVVMRDGEVTIRADSPLSVAAVGSGSSGRRKYPEGDWMTSPQWFEEVSAMFTGYSFADFEVGGRGVMVMSRGKQQWRRLDRGAALVLNAIDPWDEDKADTGVGIDSSIRVLPHGLRSDAQRRMASGQRDARVAHESFSWNPRGTMAADRFGLLAVESAGNVLAHAMFRESAKSGENLPLWAGHRMARESDGKCDHPFVIRLVEWDGNEAAVTLKLPGRVALAAKTNIMGEVGESSSTGPDPFHPGSAALRDTQWLEVQHPVEPPDWARGARLKGEAITWSALRFTMRPREVATIYADLVMGRKEWRDLDAKREVWAKTHKTA